MQFHYTMMLSLQFAVAALVFLESKIHFHIKKCTSTLSSVPVLDDPVPATRGHFWGFVRVPQHAHTHVVVCLEFVVQFCRLPVPHIHFAVSISRNQVTVIKIGQTIMKSELLSESLFNLSLYLMNISSASPHIQCAIKWMNLFFIFLKIKYLHPLTLLQLIIIVQRLKTLGLWLRTSCQVRNPLHKHIQQPEIIKNISLSAV